MRRAAAGRAQPERPQRAQRHQRDHRLRQLAGHPVPVPGHAVRAVAVQVDPDLRELDAVPGADQPSHRRAAPAADRARDRGASGG